MHMGYILWLQLDIACLPLSVVQNDQPSIVPTIPTVVLTPPNGTINPLHLSYAAFNRLNEPTEIVVPARRDTEDTRLISDSL